MKWKGFGHHLFNDWEMLFHSRSPDFMFLVINKKNTYDGRLDTHENLKHT